MSEVNRNIVYAMRCFTAELVGSRSITPSHLHILIYSLNKACCKNIVAGTTFEPWNLRISGAYKKLFSTALSHGNLCFSIIWNVTATGDISPRFVNITVLALFVQSIYQKTKFLQILDVFNEFRFTDLLIQKRLGPLVLRWNEPIKLFTRNCLSPVNELIPSIDFNNRGRSADFFRTIRPGLSHSNYQEVLPSLLPLRHAATCLWTCRSEFFRKSKVRLAGLRTTVSALDIPADKTEISVSGQVLRLFHLLKCLIRPDIPIVFYLIIGVIQKLPTWPIQWQKIQSLKT